MPNEVSYIMQNMGKLTQSQIAKNLGRSASFVKKVQQQSRKKGECVLSDIPEYSKYLIDKANKRIQKVENCWIVKKNEIMIAGQIYTLSRVLYFWLKKIDIKNLKLVKDCKSELCVNPDHFHTINK